MFTFRTFFYSKITVCGCSDLNVAFLNHDLLVSVGLYNSGAPERELDIHFMSELGQQLVLA